jgi:hypothetical protein
MHHGKILFFLYTRVLMMMSFIGADIVRNLNQCTVSLLNIMRVNRI